MGALFLMKYIRLYTETKSMNSYYYEELTGEIFLLENKQGGNGLSVGIIAGTALMIYTFVRKMEKQNHKWFFTSVVLILIMVGGCAGYRFLMILVAKSVPVYAFFNSLMCMLTILMIIAFVGNHPIKGWKIASRIREER